MCKVGVGVLAFMTKCDKGWVDCSWSVMSHFKTTQYLAHLASK